MESLSTVVTTARTAAPQVKGARVVVFDARQVSLGVGFQVELAARSAVAGKSMEEILALINDQIRRTHVVAMLDMLEYLRRGGRLGDAVAGLAGLLKFKPLIKIYDGKPSTEGVRTRERATDRLVQIMTEIGPLERLALLHSNAPDRAEDLQRKAQAFLPPGEVDIVELTRPLVRIRGLMRLASPAWLPDPIAVASCLCSVWRHEHSLKNPVNESLF